MPQKKESPVKKPAKKGAAKKSRQKTNPAKRPAAGKSAPWSDAKKALIAQLMVVCKGLDEAGVKALVSQGEALVRQKKALEKSAEKAAEKAKKAAARPSTIPMRTAPLDKFSVDVTEGKDGSYFMIGINKYRIFMARDEMKKLVRLCHLSKDAKDAGQRMFNWFKKDRGDVLYNADIEGPSDPALTTIYNYLIRTYTVKE